MDKDQEIYIESVNLIKYVVGQMANYLSMLDLHLILGQFISVIISKVGSRSMRSQLTCDKVMVHFAKNNSIGPVIVAKEIMKNIDFMNREFKNDDYLEKRSIDYLK